MSETALSCEGDRPGDPYKTITELRIQLYTAESQLDAANKQITAWHDTERQNQQLESDLEAARAACEEERLRANANETLIDMLQVELKQDRDDLRHAKAACAEYRNELEKDEAAWLNEALIWENIRREPSKGEQYRKFAADRRKALDSDTAGQSFVERLEKAEADRKLLSASIKTTEVGVNAEFERLEKELAQLRADRERLEKAEGELEIANDDYRTVNDQLKAQRDRLAEALRAISTPKQFADELCFCRTGAGLYCVGQPQCKQARDALAALQGKGE